MKIEDGTGGAWKAKVDNDFHLHTKSVSATTEESAAESGEAFILHARCHLAGAASGGLLYFKNLSSDFHYHITRSYWDSHTLTNNTLVCTVVKEPATVVSGTDITTTGIINKNYGSPITLDATLVQSDGAADLTFTGGEEYHSFALPTRDTQVRELRGTNIVTPNKTILFGWESTGNSTDGDIVSLSINMFRSPIGAQV
jgi:hypothetical protein